MLRRFLILLLLFAAARNSFARPLPTAPGKYTDWAGTLDEVEIRQPFHLRDYRLIVVLPIDTAGLALPTDNTRRPVEKNLTKATAHFAEELDNNLPNRMKVKVTAALGDTPLKGNPGTLVLRAKFSEINPGSSSARVFSLGFAGATHVTMTGEFFDGGTGTPLLTFSHHNYHGKAGLINKYTTALEENEEQIAEALSKLIKAFYP